MTRVEIKKNIFWVGAVDWNIRNFHGHTYNTKKGTTYNSYLILDDKVALVDTVLGSFAPEMISRIKEIVPLEKIDYIIANHVETDHSGAIADVLKLSPRAKIFGTAKCKEGLFRNYYGDWDFQVVKTGDNLELGANTLNFFEAPMIHWPDSMFTYCPQERLLLPNDAFGQHYAAAGRFDDQVDQAVLMDESAKYYANILWPLSQVILKKIEEIQRMDLEIDMIAPSHGVIWRKDISRIINAYISWAKNEIKPKAVVVYETMWGATEKMARMATEGLIAGGVEVKLFDISRSDRTEIFKEMLDAKGYLFGSSTHDNDMLPGMAGFLEFLKGLKPRNRVAGVFGSYGWAGGAVKNMESKIKESGVDLVIPGMSVQYMPDEKDVKNCYKSGEEFAAIIKGGR